MKGIFIDEPELEFGLGKHIDIRAGLTTLGAFDTQGPLAPRQIRLGIVGEKSSIDDFCEWVRRCSDGIAAKASPLVTLFPAFPGFGEGRLFCDIVCEPQMSRAFSRSEISKLAALGARKEAIVQSAEYFVNEIADLSQNAPIDVCVCLLPEPLMRRIDASEIEGDDEDGVIRQRDDGDPIWHDYIKSKSLRLSIPVQVVRPGTYGGKVQRYRADGKPSKEIEDEASRAWNFFTALYYKAKGIPWRLTRSADDLATCYIGISFYNDFKEDGVETSVAQVFNERGEGIILRGGRATVVKDDRSVHLTAAAIGQLTGDVLKLYKSEHRHFPARVAVHKSSYFTTDEIEGCSKAIGSLGIDAWDLVSLRKSYTRFFRNGSYPPLRGTAIQLDSRTLLLYTQGSVDFYRAFPGKYVPKAIEIHLDAAESGVIPILTEILALTKMNWNSTRFINAMPITIAAARRVGDVIRYIPSDESIHSRYSFYM